VLPDPMWVRFSEQLLNFVEKPGATGPSQGEER
jgi:hypothetical protein